MNHTWAVVLFLFTGGGYCCHGNDWVYRTDLDNSDETRLQRSFQLVYECPQDVEIRASFRGIRQQFLMLRYGSLGSRRVTIVIDHLSDTQFDLYVDKNRDLAIFPHEKIDGDGSSRRLKLQSEVWSDSGSDLLDREVQISFRQITDRISVRTLGHLEGKVDLDGSSYRVRRIDADADGLFSSRSDQIWIDLDRNNHWNDLTEQFACWPVQRIQNKRVSIQSDLASSQLTITPVSGEARIDTQYNLFSESASVKTSRVMLVGEDGAVATLGESSTTVLPGKYHIGFVYLEINDLGTGQTWMYSFSQTQEEPSNPIVLKDGQTLTIDPLRGLKFELIFKNHHKSQSAGQKLVLQPSLTTADGLYVNNVRYLPSKSFGNASAFINVRNGKQKLGEGVKSGFA